MYSNVFSCYPFHFIVDLYYFCIFCFINYIVYCYIVVVNKLKPKKKKLKNYGWSDYGWSMMGINCALICQNFGGKLHGYR